MIKKKISYIKSNELTSASLQIMLKYIARHMRTMDKFECKAFGQSPLQALTESIRMCGQDNAWIIMGNNLPLGVMGCMPAIDGGAAFWLLGTNKINEYSRQFYVESIKQRDIFLQRFTYLTNRVCMDHKESVRWLTKLGAKFKQEKVILLGHEFQQFYIWR